MEGLCSTLPDVLTCIVLSILNIVLCFFLLTLAHAFEGHHQRAVNKLSFHPREPNVLLSGSQDSHMNVFVSVVDCFVCTVILSYCHPGR